jgi:hypothetical protein
VRTIPPQLLPVITLLDTFGERNVARTLQTVERELERTSEELRHESGRLRQFSEQNWTVWESLKLAASDSGWLGALDEGGGEQEVPAKEKPSSSLFRSRSHDHTGVSYLADAKRRLSDLQNEVANRIDATLDLHMTLSTANAGLAEYCHELWPSHCDNDDALSHATSFCDIGIGANAQKSFIVGDAGEHDGPSRPPASLSRALPSVPCAQASPPMTAATTIRPSPNLTCHKTLEPTEAPPATLGADLAENDAASGACLGLAVEPEEKENSQHRPQRLLPGSGSGGLTAEPEEKEKSQQPLLQQFPPPSNHHQQPPPSSRPTNTCLKDIMDAAASPPGFSMSPSLSPPLSSFTASQEVDAKGAAAHVLAGLSGRGGIAGGSGKRNDLSSARRDGSARQSGPS